MEKDKSLIYSLLEKFTRKQEEQQSKQNTTDTQKTPENNEETPPKTDPIDTRINFMSEICLSFGYDPEYSKGINISDRLALDKALLPIAKDYLLKKDSGESIDASAFLFISTDTIRALLFVFPPLNNGKEIEANDLRAIIEKNKVVYGINEDLLSHIPENNGYCKTYLIAQGQQAVNGHDGMLVEYVKVIKEATFIEGDDRRIDFKNLNLENNIVKDTPICKIIPHTSGVDGINVLGKKITGKQGKKLPSPSGNGTYIPENSTMLLAEIDGRLSYHSGKYCVENSFVVNGNVDNSVGNINFLGDVIVKGRVRSGFNVTAGGSIFIEGSAGDCILTAQNEIVIKDGINADSHGKLEAGGNITCKFIENCTVTSGGNITTGSIINSSVFADDSINVNLEKGTVLNSKLTAYNSIKANTVGSDGSKEVRIILGKSHTLASEASMLKRAIPETKKTINKISKNIEFLESSKDLPAPKLIVLSQLKEQLNLYTAELEVQHLRKDEIDNLSRDCSRCKFESSLIHPPCRVNIGGYNYWVKQKTLNTSFRVFDDEIKLLMSQ